MKVNALIFVPSELEMSQMLEEHPFLRQKESYKTRYLNALDYFLRKYAGKDPWAFQTFQLYVRKILGEEKKYQYGGFPPFCSRKPQLFVYFPYHCCLLLDCIFLCAYNDKKKAKVIFWDVASICPGSDPKEFRKFFDSLYDPSVLVRRIDPIRSLKSCWDVNRAHIRNKPVKILVTATVSAGKSTLLNALVGRKVNKTQHKACTAKIHVLANKPFEDGLCCKLDYRLTLDADPEKCLTDDPDNRSSEILIGTHFRTIGASPGRVWLIDTPGVNSAHYIEHKLLTENAIRSSEADLLIYLLNAQNIGVDDDRRHLLFVRNHYFGKILFVVNQLDGFKKKEDSVEETLQKAAEELSGLGFEDPRVVPVSAYAAFLAKKVLFHELLDEDEQSDYRFLAEKMEDPELWLNACYPGEENAADAIRENEKSCRLLLHSGLLQLENIIYNMR